MRVDSRTASGASLSEAVPAMAAASAAKTSTETSTRRPGTPAARMAVISPSLDMRPRPIRMPTSTPKGMVSGSTAGMPSANSHAVVAGLAELRTSSPSSGPTPCRKITQVASSVPMKALATISRKT